LQANIINRSLEFKGHRDGEIIVNGQANRMGRLLGLTSYMEMGKLSGNGQITWKWVGY